MKKQNKQPTKACKQHFLCKTACFAQPLQLEADIGDRTKLRVHLQRHRARSPNRILAKVKRHVASNGRQTPATLGAERGSTIVTIATARVDQITPWPWPKRMLCVAAELPK